MAEYAIEHSAVSEAVIQGSSLTQRNTMVLALQKFQIALQVEILLLRQLANHSKLGKYQSIAQRSFGSKTLGVLRIAESIFAAASYHSGFGVLRMSATLAAQISACRIDEQPVSSA